MYEVKNVHTDGPLQGKLDKGTRCGHCGNTGLVLIDGVRNVGGTKYDVGAAPCPMCLVGKWHNVNSSTVEDRRYWSLHPVDGATWNDGLTVRHTGSCLAPAIAESRNGERCLKPSVGKVCAYHAANPAPPSKAQKAKVRSLTGRDPWDG